MKKIVRLGTHTATLTQFQSGLRKGSWKVTYKNLDGTWAYGGLFKELEKARKKAFDILRKIESRTVDNITQEESDMLVLIREAKISGEDLQSLVSQKERCKPRPLGEVVKDWYDYHTERNDLSAPHLRTLRKAINGLTEYLGYDKMFSQIQPTDIDGWLISLNLGHKRFNTLRSVFTLMWKWAVLQGIAVENVASLVPPATGKKKSGGHEVLSPLEYAKMLNAPPEGFLAWLCLGGFAGLRTSEICGAEGREGDRLEWSDFDWKNKRIIIRPETSKTSLPRFVPICDALAAWLEHLKKGNGYVHNTVGPGYYKGNNPHTSATAKLKRLIEATSWRKNCLRASRASYRLAQTNDIGLTASEDGHTVRQLKSNYLNPRFQEDQELWWSLTPEKVEELLGGM